MGEKKPYLAVILVQSIYAGMFLVSKAAFNVGMNNFVFVFYRQTAATLFLAPLALFLEWKNRPPLSFVTFCKIFLLSFCGITLSLDIYGIALVYTSATLAAATTNCLPVITFFLALLLRIEVLKLRTFSGIAKLIGIIACMAGAATLAFFKGPHFKLLCNHQIFGSYDSQELVGHVSSGKTWIKGCFLMLMSNTFWGLWLVLQGIMVTGVTFYVQAWVIEKKGPVFLAMSTPLNLIFTMFCSALLLCEIISLGSVMGGVLLVGGLYSVLWGKSKEEKMKDKICIIGDAEQKECSELKQVIPSGNQGTIACVI
ncbi:WAT1-related protein At5g64700 isoform X3 [Hevea brasiliensis]|uniref:WAT1-related protein At5g64700 isoform X3 n=1 Tax=Hevea brasiliensis TaxID=3981 RepID=UPI0025CFD970|nr:WAT1-related protein At5g64700 isoform X3 [Hevea brasiliensis]